MENVRRAKNAPDFSKLHKQWDSKLQKVLIFVRSVVFLDLLQQTRPRLWIAFRNPGTLSFETQVALEILNSQFRDIVLTLVDSAFQSSKVAEMSHRGLLRLTFIKATVLLLWLYSLGVFTISLDKDFSHFYDFLFPLHFSQVMLFGFMLVSSLKRVNCWTLKPLFYLFKVRNDFM